MDGLSQLVSQKSSYGGKSPSVSAQCEYGRIKSLNVIKTIIGVVKVPKDHKNLKRENNVPRIHPKTQDIRIKSLGGSKT